MLLSTSLKSPSFLRKQESTASKSIKRIFSDPLKKKSLSFLRKQESIASKSIKRIFSDPLKKKSPSFLRKQESIASKSATDETVDSCFHRKDRKKSDDRKS
jgi:hypothetical protein